MRLLIAALMLLPTLALGQSITGVAGTVADSAAVTITGTSFGANGPTIILFDSFQRGSDGADLTLSADIGSWTSINSTYTPEFIDDDAAGGNIADRAVIGGVHHQARKTFPSPVTEYFISYRMKVPDGKDFPYAFSEETFPSVSAFKVIWIMDGADGYYGNDDYCLPTWGNGVYWGHSGNDVASTTEIGRPGTSTQWWSWDNWCRMSIYMKAGSPDPAADNGIIWTTGMSAEYGQTTVLRTDTPVFDGDDSPDCCGGFEDDAISQWDRLYVPGWNTAGDSNAEVWYDDVYIAAGDYAFARVELGDNATYANCTRLDICTPTSWSDTSVAAITRAPSFALNETAYIFVIDSDNSASSGYAVIIGAEGDASIVAPSNLTATKLSP